MRKARWVVLGLMWCLVGLKPVQAAQPYQPQIVNPLTQAWRWKHFPELEGKGIREVVESADQRVWVGSNEGLLEYDGYSWKMHGEADGLPQLPVQKILVAEDGIIYAANEIGLFRYQNDQWQPFFSTSEQHPFIFYQLKELRDHSIVACTDWGVIHFQKKGGIRFYSSASKKESLQEAVDEVEWVMFPSTVLNDQGDLDYASDVLEERSGAVWLAVTTQMEGGSLLRLKAWEEAQPFDDYEYFVASKKLPIGEGQRMLQADDGRIWVISSTSNKGILIYDSEEWQIENIGERFGGDEYVADMVQSADGTIWLGGMARIFSYNAGQWEMYRAPKFPVPPNRILLHHSSNNRLWVLGRRSKILQLDLAADQWVAYQDLSFQVKVADDEEWFLERNNRLVRRKGNTWTSYGTEDGLPDAPVRLIHTSQGQLWVAGSHKGKAATAVLSPEGWQMQRHVDFSWGIDYRAVFEDRDGGLWFGAAVDADPADGYRSGVLHLLNPLAENFEWERHRHQENGLGQANSYGIGQSPDGLIWIGGTQLLNYDGEQWNVHPDEKLQQYVNYIYSTPDLLLVGSRYYGLFVYDGKTWKNYDTSDGLPSNTIISIDALSDGTFLISTENSICRFDGVNWTRDIFPEELNMDFEGGTIFHTDEYIWVNNVPRSWKRRAFQSGTNLINNESPFFATRYRPGSNPPETMVEFFVETVSPQGNCLVSWSGKDYFAQSNTDELSFSYRLNGGEWSPYSAEQQKNFTSLLNGDYTLEVRARNLDFVVDPTPAVITFKVLPPIWKRGWFIALILLFLVIYGVYEYRVVTKKQKLELLNHSLQTANEELRNKSEQIEQQNSEILAQQSQILEQAAVLETQNHDLAERNEEIRMQHGQLEQMVEQVENLSKAKLAFFTNISHELRTPLTLILGPIRQLEKQGLEMPPTEQKKLQKIIGRNASRLLKLINQLLEIRRIEQQSLAVNLSEVALPQYLEGIVALFENLAQEREIALNFTDHTPAGSVAVDVDKVEKILANILSNAFKFTKKGGQISLELTRVDALEHELDPIYNDYFQLRISDTGCGISADRMENIFDKFYSSESEMSGMSHSGIGLSYVRDLVYLLQGDIRVESQLGQGTTFNIYFPYVQAMMAADFSATDKPEEAFHVARREVSLLLSSFSDQKTDIRPQHHTPIKEEDKPTVLVVDDNPDMLHFLETLLEDDYSVLLAEDGQQGYHLAENTEVDLILSDVMMPGLDGISLCGKLKNNFTTSHIPVILLTAKVLDDSKASGYLKGADDYIAKPFNPELLKIRIKNLLTQRTQLRDRFTRDFLLQPKAEKIVSADEELLQRLVDLMNENLGEAEFNVNKMCQMVNLSHMHFIRKVKQLTGKKPVDLLKSFRMKKAKDLLAQRKLTIAEVAYQVGFDLPNSFSRAFKKEFEMTPTEFVNSLPEEVTEDFSLS